MQERNPAQAVTDEPRAFDETQLARRWDISVRTLQQWRQIGAGRVPKDEVTVRNLGVIAFSSGGGA